MISPWLIYLYSICGGLNILAIVLLGITFFCIWLFAEDDVDSLNKWHRNVCITIFIISVLIIILTPNKSEMLAIIASMTITPDNFPTDMHTYIQELMKECGKL